MKRYAFYLDEKKLASLESLNELSVSEHIRRAIDEYLPRKQAEVSQSPTKYEKRKG